ncbi:hypothetical protein ANI01nite_33080 [Glutamicibacter nicotianae]|uniref:Uncharacterized protein n=1 Tax=Glutamicibacter nicotianae TaxID=37929 RepID=A0ABQ0RQM6_GLUNI|nr:hypothetical protein [Glutamicibacter nicotianae]GEC14105.1 hypothetical protein ANI01nite_33080 [Glutamicibacter nicotianae]
MTLTIRGAGANICTRYSDLVIIEATPTPTELNLNRPITEQGHEDKVGRRRHTTHRAARENKFSLPEGAKILAYEGGAHFVGLDGEILGGIAPAWAVDATGAESTNAL